MAKEKKIVMNPPAELPPRDDDVPLRLERYLQISLFARLKSKPSVEKFPGTLCLRRFHQGEVICRQGEAGWSAFYPLTGADVEALRDELPGATGKLPPLPSSPPRGEGRTGSCHRDPDFGAPGQAGAGRHADSARPRAFRR
jgi:hypothetical protein